MTYTKRRIVAVIPARLNSTRLPRKVLAEINGRPLIWHVWNRVKQATSFNDIYIATDSEEVREVVEIWGGRVLITRPECRSGTERIASIIDQLDAELIVNVQGDEPLVDPGMLDALVKDWIANPADLITPVFEIKDLADIVTPNTVKVARAASGQALYFSRSTIPFVRDTPQNEWLDRHRFWGHIGVYGYRRDVLSAYPRLPVSSLEEAEQLEQLRFLDAGYRIQTTITTYRSIAVDVQEDLERVRTMISSNISND